MKLPQFMYLEQKAKPLTFEQVSDTKSEWNPLVNGVAFWACPRAALCATKLANGCLLLKFEQYGVFAQVPDAELPDINLSAVLEEFGFERLDA